MTLAEQFATAVTKTYSERASRLELLPEVMAQASAAVLGVSGAGISLLMDGLRVPLGASDETTAYAERLQTTLGEGPCLEVVGSTQAAAFDRTTLAARWPVFSGELVAKTPLRSIASLPIRASDVPTTGALDLYSTEDDGLSELPLDEISTAIVATIGTTLFAAPSAGVERGSVVPLWLSNDSVTSRMDVWIALGTVMEEAAVTAESALAALRAYARSHQASLDEVAQQLADQTLSPELVLSSSNGLSRS